MPKMTSTIPSELHQAGLHGHGSVVPVRQTVLAGRVDGNGQANFLEAGAGFAINLKASQVPVEVAFAAGFHKGALDYVERIDADVDAAWTLPASATSFLYVDRDPNTGLISFGHTPVAPHYGAKTKYALADVSGSTTSTISALAGSGAENLFDGDPSTIFHSTQHANTGTITQSLNTPFILREYVIRKREDAYPLRAPRDWRVEGFDGHSWEILDTRIGETGWGSGESRRYTVVNDTSYQAYRLVILASNGGDGYLVISGWDLYTHSEGSHWFDLSTMTMKVWNGSAWVPKQRVFIGEAVTDGSGVTSVITYALQGRYSSGRFPVTANTNYTKSHNIGAAPETIVLRGASTAGGVLSEFSNITWSGSYYGVWTGSHDRNTIHLEVLNPELRAPGTSTVVEADLIVERGWGMGGGSAVTDQPSTVELEATQVPVRQTVLDGRTDAEGRANFLEVIPPTYSDNLCTGGTPIASSYYGAGYEPSLIFDGNQSTYWSSPAGSSNQNFWVGYQFSQPKVIRKMSLIQYPPNSDYNVSSLLVESSQNGIDWTTIATITVEVATTFMVPNSTPATYWRIRANSSTPNGTYWAVSDLKMMDITIEGGGLTVDLKATEKPVVLAFADGFGERGAIDYVKRIKQDIPAAWSLPPNQTSYLYVDLDRYGNASFGVSPLPPSYTASMAHVSKVSLTPAMSSYTAGSITVSASSEYDAYNAVWNAFNKIIGSTSGAYYTSATVPASIEVDFGKPENVTRYTILPYQHATERGYDPRDWTVEARNSLDDPWTVLDTITNYAFSGMALSSFELNNHNKYRYYRINVSASNGQPQIVIDEIDLLTDSDSWFDLTEFKMKVRQGVSLEPRLRLYVGEAVTGPDSVISLVTYALRGQYETRVPIQSAAIIAKSHNLGVVPRNISSMGSLTPGGPLYEFLNTDANGSILLGMWLGDIQRNSLKLLCSHGATYVVLDGHNGAIAVEAYVKAERGW